MKKIQQEKGFANTNTVHRKLLILFTGAILLLLLFPQVVFSLGVAPSFYNLDSESGFQTLKLRVLNTYEEDMYVKLQASGELAKYVDYDSKTIHLTPSESSKTLYYTFDIPDDLPPGSNELRMVLVQLAEGSTGNEKTAVDARISVIQKVTVFVPYPGSYLTGTLFAESSTTNNPITFTTHVISKGNEDVEVTGTVRIRGPTNEILGTVAITETIVSSQTDKRLTVSYPGLAYAGNYQAESIIRYGDKELVLTKGFSVGSKNVKATDLIVERFKLGEIVKIKAKLENEWNSRIESLYMQVKILNEQGTIVSEFTSSPVEIGAYESKEIDAFWDTEGVRTGSYDVAVDLFFDEKVIETFFKAVIGAENVQFVEQGLTGKVIDVGDGNSSPDSTNKTNLIILLAIVLIVINALLLTKFKFTKKKEKNKGRKRHN